MPKHSASTETRPRITPAQLAAAHASDGIANTTDAVIGQLTVLESLADGKYNAAFRSKDSYKQRFWLGIREQFRQIAEGVNTIKTNTDELYKLYRSGEGGDQ